MRCLLLPLHQRVSRRDSTVSWEHRPSVQLREGASPTYSRHKHNTKLPSKQKSLHLLCLALGFAKLTERKTREGSFLLHAQASLPERPAFEGDCNEDKAFGAQEHLQRLATAA